MPRLETAPVAQRERFVSDHRHGLYSMAELCSRYGIDNSRRTKHGALLDSEILAEVYIELIGGKQPDLGLTAARAATTASNSAAAAAARAPRTVVMRLSDAEREAHRAFVATLGPNALWRPYLGDTPP